MNPQTIPMDAFKNFAASNNWGALWPELSIALLACFLLALDLFVPKSRKSIIPGIALAGQAVVLITQLFSFNCSVLGQSLFSGMVEISMLGQFFRVFFILTSLLVCYLGWVYLKRQNLPRTEFYALTMLIAAAMMLLSHATNFVMLFVALETVTIGFYVMVAYARHSPYSLESGLKYLIMGGLSTSLLLFGIVLLYGVAGDSSLPNHTGDGLNFANLHNFAMANADNPLLLVGAALVLCGICFKIGAVPFQIWIPDVYQGAPTPVTAFLAVGSKAAGFVVLINLIQGPFTSLHALTFPLLAAIAAVTILFGNIGAVGQQNIKRMIGMSGIAHAGYLLLGVLAYIQGVDWALWAITFYLFTYLLASFAVAGVMAHVAGPEDENQELEHYQNLAKNQPFLAAVLAIGLGSLAGIPPLAGFIGKLLIFIAAFEGKLYALLGVAIVGVVISIYYYFGWIREAYFKTLDIPEDPGSEAPKPAPHPKSIGIAHRLLLGSLAALTVLLGLYQGAFGSNPF